MDQRRQGYFHSDPGLHFRGTNISVPTVHTVVAASGSTPSPNPSYRPDGYFNVLMNGVTQFPSIQHQHNLDMDVPAAGNMYYSGMNSSSRAGALPPPLNHSATDQLPGSITAAVSGGYKRKNAEMFGGNYQNFNASASSSVAPPNASYNGGVGTMDIPSFSLPQHRGNGVPSLVEIGSHGSSWSGLGESVMLHDHNHLTQGNYLGQHFQQSAPSWLDQHFNRNINDGHATAWNQSLPVAYLQALDVLEGPLGDASMGLQMYHDTASNRNGFGFPHPPPVNPQHHNFRNQTPPMIGQSIGFHPPAASFRAPANPSRSSAMLIPTNFEMGARHVGNSGTSAGLRRHRSHGGIIPEATLGHQNFSPMHFIQFDDVALLVDNHGDMRLDIDGMSYEASRLSWILYFSINELLALEEQIGNVSTGLTEEMITAGMKTKTYSIPAFTIDLEEVATEEEEYDTCTVCMDEYNIGEEIGILGCGHEFHADCLKQWLIVKNVCPICKSEALASEGRV
ncbi:hypothetical protein RIF29_30969 [Crotalaria pallida]|uniref:RING-type E3 ubiquitin transferase n=1 Tax=Crotalaria pallida TaxID=3830 RepID=A0AAN9HYJ4_CROPI